MIRSFVPVCQAGTAWSTTARSTVHLPLTDASARPPRPGTRPDWRSLCDVINALGGRADYDSPREIFNEIRQVVPSYAGMDYTRLAEEQGLCWPCPTPGHPGAP